jgi:hypothetical protein
VKHLTNARLVVINSEWGHMCKFVGFDLLRMVFSHHQPTAGGGSNVQDDKFIQAQIKSFLEEP